MIRAFLNFHGKVLNTNRCNNASFYNNFRLNQVHNNITTSISRLNMLNINLPSLNPSLKPSPNNNNPNLSLNPTHNTNPKPSHLSPIPNNTVVSNINTLLYLICLHRTSRDNNNNSHVHHDSRQCSRHFNHQYNHPYNPHNNHHNNPRNSHHLPHYQQLLLQFWETRQETNKESNSNKPPRKLLLLLKCHQHKRLLNNNQTPVQFKIVNMGSLVS
mmetsp:Transcript_31657/g.43433  ORF Transcript_31657/g.43433 Transcript_31657/m.43433 type:complete len:215 (+) Transcript_31657:769-1413(+)